MDPIPPGGLSAMDTHVHGGHNTHVDHVSNGHLHGHPHHPHHAQHVQVDHDPQDLHEEEREVIITLKVLFTYLIISNYLSKQKLLLLLVVSGVVGRARTYFVIFGMLHR